MFMINFVSNNLNYMFACITNNNVLIKIKNSVSERIKCVFALCCPMTSVYTGHVHLHFLSFIILIFLHILKTFLFLIIFFRYLNDSRCKYFEISMFLVLHFLLVHTYFVIFRLILKKKNWDILAVVKLLTLEQG